MSLEDKLKKIVEDQNYFSAERKVAIIKAIAEEKCKINPRRLRRLGEDRAEKKYQKCVKKKTSELWWTMLMQREPVVVKDLKVTINGKGIDIKKEGV